MNRLIAQIRIVDMSGTGGLWQPIPYNEIQGLDSLSIDWRLNESGNISRAVSADLRLLGGTATRILSLAQTQSIELRIYDTEFNRHYPTFLVQPQMQSGCLSDPCYITVTPIEKEPTKTCFDSTVIWDNHQGWFDRSGTLKHPRFLYCNYPNIGWLTGFLYVSVLTLSVIASAINLLLTAIGITGLSDFLVGLINDVKGCSLVHPSPLVRTYIKNVCDKCGIEVDAGSFWLFFSQGSPYYNTAVFYAPIREGYDRDTTANSTYYIHENVYNKSLTEFLNELAAHYNGKWRVFGNKLYFKNKNEPFNSDPLYNFGSYDAHRLVSDICWTWNSKPRPAYFDGIHEQDGIDLRGNTALGLYNYIIDWNSPESATQSGALSPQSPFAATRFRNDGIGNDPISRLEQNGVLSGVVSVISFLTFGNFNPEVAPHAIVLSDNQTSKAKLVVWNEASGLDSAEAVYTGIIVGSPLYDYLRNEKGVLGQDDTNYSMYYYNWPNIVDAAINNGTYGGVPMENIWDFWKNENPRSDYGQTRKDRAYTITICLSEYDLDRLGLFADMDAALFSTIIVGYELAGPSTPIYAEIDSISVNLATNEIVITASR